MAAKKLLHLFGFSTTLTLNGEYLLNDIDNRVSALESTKCPYSVQNFVTVVNKTA